MRNKADYARTREKLASQPCPAYYIARDKLCSMLFANEYQVRQSGVRVYSSEEIDDQRDAMLRLHYD